MVGKLSKHVKALESNSLFFVVVASFLSGLEIDLLIASSSMM